MINEPPEERDQETGPIVRPGEPVPTPEPWYDDMVVEFAAAQTSTKRAHERLAEAWSAAATNMGDAAVHYDRLAVLIPAPASAEFHGLAMRWRLAAMGLASIGEAHAELAKAIPDATQAAADLGTAAERHDVNNLRTVVQGDQTLNVMRDRAVDEMLRRLKAIEAQLRDASTERGQILDAVNGRGADDA